MGQLLWKVQLYLRYFVLLRTLDCVRHIPSYEAVSFTPIGECHRPVSRVPWCRYHLKNCCQYLPALTKESMNAIVIMTMIAIDMSVTHTVYMYVTFPEPAWPAM